ncbi:hypothetical protein PVAP13_4NG311701 [Panicum virgatum]|uniref:Secreted protein n=1 Tax=Panicum virgatum TaxID=38727 RepID=A0A8T0TF66_PANVG|nr:hypothetical protein PVAP13_4NG311701 [Panicum virgatum]
MWLCPVAGALKVFYGLLAKAACKKSWLCGLRANREREEEYAHLHGPVGSIRPIIADREQEQGGRKAFMRHTSASRGARQRRNPEQRRPRIKYGASRAPCLRSGWGCLFASCKLSPPSSSTKRQKCWELGLVAWLCVRRGNFSPFLPAWKARHRGKSNSVMSLYLTDILFLVSRTYVKVV